MRQRPDLRRAQKRRRRVPDLLVQRIARTMMHTGKAHFLLVHSILQQMNIIVKLSLFISL
jgi:hypothetical protein